MKKTRKNKREHGAILVLTAVLLTVLLGFTALSIDIGLHHYLGAKLQNAVDAAAIAVAQGLDTEEGSLEDIAYDYMAKNGYDRLGDYKDGKLKVTIKPAAIKNEATARSLMEADNARYEAQYGVANHYKLEDYYLTSGFYKVTADVDDTTLLASVLGIDSLHLNKSAYVRAEAEYDAVPDALKYSIFAGATKGTATNQVDDAGNVIYVDDDHPAMDILGKNGAGTGSNNAFATVIGATEGLINGAWSFAQNIYGWFNSDYAKDNNPLVNINLSEAVFNNDAHSNANIMIGVQAINISRVKDADYDGSSLSYGTYEEYEAAVKNNEASAVNMSVNDSTVQDEFTDSDDFGQVHFTAVDEIEFGASQYAQEKTYRSLLDGGITQIASNAGNNITAFNYNYVRNHPEYTRVYVQNQQWLMVTQHIVNILNTINLESSSISTTNALKDAYQVAANEYFNINKGLDQTTTKEKVLAQKDNLVLDKENKQIILENQSSVVYRINQARAQRFLQAYDGIYDSEGADASDPEITRFSLLNTKIKDIGWDTATDSSGKGIYERNGDSTVNLTYPTILLKRTYTEGGVEKNYTFKVDLTTTGDNHGNLQVNRNTDTVLGTSTPLATNGDGSFTEDATDTSYANYTGNDASFKQKSQTYFGAYFSTVRSFRENSYYIDIPNLKPYFTRAIFKSVSNATTKKGGFAQDSWNGQAGTIVDAVDLAVKDIGAITSGLNYVKDTTETDNNGDPLNQKAIEYNDSLGGGAASKERFDDESAYFNNVDGESYPYEVLFTRIKGEDTSKTATNGLDFIAHGNSFTGKGFTELGDTAKTFNVNQDQSNDSRWKGIGTLTNNYVKADYSISHENYAYSMSYATGNTNQRDYSSSTLSLLGLNNGNSNGKITRSFKVFDDDKTLRTPAEVINDFDTKVGNQFAKKAINAFEATSAIANEKNAVANKETELNNQYGYDGTNGYQAKERDFKNLVKSITKPGESDQSSSGSSDSFAFIGTPTVPLPKNSELKNKFLGGGGAANGISIDANTPGSLRTNFNTLIANNNADNSATDLVKVPSGSVTITEPGAYRTYSAVSVPAVADYEYKINNNDAFPTPSAYSIPAANSNGITNNGGSIGNFNSNVGDAAYTLPNNTYYSSIENPFYETKTLWWTNTNYRSIAVGNGTDEYKNLVTGNISLAKEGKSVDIKNNATLYVGGNIYVNKESNGQNCNINVLAGGKLYTGGNFDVSSTNASETTIAGLAHIGGYVWADADITIASGGKLIACGNNRMTSNSMDAVPNYTADFNYSASVVSNGHLTVNGELYMKGDYYGNTGSRNITIGDNGIMVVDGKMYSRQNITVGSGALLYVTGDIRAWSNITNNGTIICGGKIYTNDGSITNNGTIQANAIDVSIGNTSSINSNRGNYTNNAGAKTVVTTNLECYTLSNISGSAGTQSSPQATTVTVGGNLTAHGDLNNTSGSAGYNDPTVQVNGNLTVTGTVNNNASSGVASWSFINVGGTTSCGTLNQYERAFFAANNTVTIGTLNNGNYCELVTTGTITINSSCTNSANALIKADGNVTVTNCTNNANAYIYSKATVKFDGSTKHTNNGYVWAKDVNVNCNVDSSGVMLATETISVQSGKTLDAATGTLRCGTDLNVAGTVKSNGTFAVYGSVKAIGANKGTITCVNMTVYGSLTARSLTTTGNVRVNDDVSLSYSLKLDSTSANFTCADGDIYAYGIDNSGSIFVKGDLEASSSGIVQKNGSQIQCYGSITCGGDLTNGTSSGNYVIKCRGSITVTGVLYNSGTIYIGYLNASGENEGRGNLTLQGNLYNASSSDWNISYKANGGSLYACGNVNSSSGFRVMNSGETYILGNLVSATSNGGDIVEIDGGAKVYIRGTASTTRSGVNVWIHGSAGAGGVLSILGNGAASGEDCFKNSLTKLVNTQEGSIVYIATNLYLSGNNSSNGETLSNAGRLYVFGSIDAPNAPDVSLYGTYTYTGDNVDSDFKIDDAAAVYSGLTYCYNSFNAPNAKITIQGKHLLYVARNPANKTYGDNEYNIVAEQLAMSGDGMLYAPDKAKFTTTDSSIANTVVATDNAIINVINKLEITGQPQITGKAMLIAPYELNYGNDSDLPVYTSMEFGKNISNYSLRLRSLTLPTNAKIVVHGDLIVTNDITINKSQLIVEGYVTCRNISMTDGEMFVSKYVSATGTVDMVGKSTRLNRRSVMVADDYINAGGAMTLNASTLFAENKYTSSKDSITAASMNLSNDSVVCAREVDNDNAVKEINVGGSIVANHSKVLVMGELTAYNLLAYSASSVGGTKSFDIVGQANGNYDYVNVDFDGSDYTNQTTQSFVFFGPDSDHFGVDTVSGNHENIDIINNGILVLPEKNGKTLEARRIQIGPRTDSLLLCYTAIKTAASGSPWFMVGTNEAQTGGILYCSKLVTIDGYTITNYGKMYNMGGTDLTNGVNTFTEKEVSKSDIDFKTGSENFLGKIYKNGSITSGLDYRGYYEGKGNVYIDGNLTLTSKYSYTNNFTCGDGNANPSNKSRKVAVHITDGTTYISGNLVLPYDQAGHEKRDGKEEERSYAIRLESYAGLVVEKDVTTASVIYNFGDFHIFGKLNMMSAWENGNDTVYFCTDDKDIYQQGGSNSVSTSDYKYGNSVLNFGSFLIANYDKETLTDADKLTFLGVISNYGRMYINQNLNVAGYNHYSQLRNNASFYNWNGANAHIGGSLYLNSKQLYNEPNATVACEGNLLYGHCIYNMGTVYAGGDISNDEGSYYTSLNSLKGDDNDRDGTTNSSESISFMNGSYLSDGDSGRHYEDSFFYPSAMVYCGGHFKLGTAEHGSNANAGSLFNVGSLYVKNDLDVFTNTDRSHYKTAIWAWNNSSTFVGGHVFGGGAVATGDNSIFMCGGDFRSIRCVKLNVHFYTWWENAVAAKRSYYTYNDDDYNTPAYFYCGKNFIANVSGKSLWNIQNVVGIRVPDEPAQSRDTQIYSNTNVFIGGSYYSNAKSYIGRNVAMLVAGADTLYKSNTAFKDDYLNSNEVAQAVINRISDVLNGISGKKYVFFAYQLLDLNIGSKIVVNGPAFVKDTCKIRDMAKVYVDGNFRCNSYVEVGKALDGADETEAKETAFRSSEDDAWKTRYRQRNSGKTAQDAEQAFIDNYTFKNSGYLVVNGDYESARYTKVFASTTLMAIGNAKIGYGENFVSGIIFGVLDKGYLNVRHDGRMFVGGDVNVRNYIDGGPYSEIYVLGSMSSAWSNIKLRDQSTVYIGGSMTAPQYIELGKYDETFFRGVKNGRSIDDNIERNETTGTNSGDGSEDNYDSENEDSDTDSEKTSDGNGGGTGDIAETSGEEHAADDAETTYNGTTVDDYVITYDAEYSNDTSDRAVGANIYVKGNIVSNRYIREYAYSSVVAGGYVYAPQHITLRHNADFWVLPEAYGLNNTTYMYKPYASTLTENSSWLDKVWDKIKEAAYVTKDAVSPKQGSMYTTGQLTLNTNASVFATYDVMVFGQTTLRGDSLIYTGHDFDCWAPMVNNVLDNIKVTLQSAFGGDSEKAARSYKGFDSYDAQDRDRDERNPHPIIVYANHEINVATTVTMRATYLIANQSDVNFTDLNLFSNTSDVTISQMQSLPNAFSSYQNDVNFYTTKATMGALFYAPAGKVGIDGGYFDMYGCILGRTVNIDTYFFKVHRFNNWRDMDLHVATSKKAYFISEDAYNDAIASAKENNSYTDDMYIYGYNPNQNEDLGWAAPFFPGND